MLHLIGHSEIQQFLTQYGYWAVFVLVGLENAGIPLPGEIILVSAAILAAATHEMDIALVILAAATGGVLGANLGYWIGREYGFRLLLRHGRVAGIGERELKLGQYLFLRYGGKVVFFGRLVAVLRVLAAILAGVNRMPWPAFMISNVGGGVMWAALYGGGAYLLGSRIKSITGPVGVVCLTLAMIALVLGLRYIRGHQRALEEAAERALPGPLKADHQGRHKSDG